MKSFRLEETMVFTFIKIETDYIWDGSSFDNKEYFFFIDNYPNEPQNVIEHFIDILWLEKNYGSNKQTENRLQELIIRDKVKKADLNEYINNLYIEENQIDGENNLKFEQALQSDNTINLTVEFKKGIVNKKLNFELKLENERWRISEISEVTKKDG